MDYRNFFAELKRRRVYSVAVAYVAVAWLLIQVATQVFPFFDIPNGIVRLLHRDRAREIRTGAATGGAGDGNRSALFYDVDPIASVYAAENRWAEAAQRYETLPADLMSKPNFQLAICYAQLGREDEARRILADLEALAQRRYVDQMHFAAIHAALGEKDEAFAALDRAADARSARVSTPPFYSLLAPLFDDPRFAALEEKVAHSAILAPSEAQP